MKKKLIFFLCSNNFPFEKEVNINVYIIEKILKVHIYFFSFEQH
jgi:hypothetical protein